MTRKRQLGFSLLEMMAALLVLLVVAAIVMSGMNQMMNSQGQIANRTEMHAGVRSATELLQQEIGQAGKVSLAAPNANVTLHAAVAASPATAVSFSLDASTGSAPAMYPTEALTVDEGPNQEVINVSTATGTPPSSGTATFLYAHAAGVPVVALGAFATGIVPPQTSPTYQNGYTYTNGSTGTVLKLYGDINNDGNMLYVEYNCTQGTVASPGFLYRNEMALTATSKPAVDNTMILLGNLLPNPNDANNNPVPCFNYQVQALGSGYVVTDVAVTLTVQPQKPDPQTGALVPETKALLNISPRNVFEVWDTARLVDPTRAQSMPPNVTANLLYP